MNYTTTIRSELEDFIEREGLNLSQLGRKAGLNAGTVSSILKGNRIMAVDQLDRMTKVLNLPEGYYYEQYIQECIVETVPNWRRIRPFLFRCAELDSLDCIRRSVQLLLDNLTYSPLLFEVAEEFLTAGKHKAAIILYESVAASERRQHSERLAFCQYRLFTLRLGDNQERNLQAAIQFEPFVDRLDETDQLDALRELANTYKSLQRWDKVDEIAEELGNKAKIQLQLPSKLVHRRGEAKKKLKRPLFVYLTFSYLLRGGVCDARGAYEEALQYAYKYADLSWVKDEDEETQKWVKLFKGWAKANIFVYKLRIGHESVISDYAEFIDHNEDELLIGIHNIASAANKFDFDIDPILEKYKSRILAYATPQPESIGMYTHQIIAEESTLCFYELAYYYLSRKAFPEGFKYLLAGLVKANFINKDTRILSFVRLFEKFRDYATFDIQRNYQNLMKREIGKHEKKSGGIVSGK
ncbi:helix-turn-helix transcriptional regulator [Paenibacillus pedocola]|uniref:helix-turn-helix transcriptional regulator n=1 Tax=Paenibacillus pedocola TaxID=3242193 RepID=UPI002877B54E|nr:helix-turn-helix transcriptional regulator [Paenibacillus typhae]